MSTLLSDFTVSAPVAATEPSSQQLLPVHQQKQLTAGAARRAVHRQERQERQTKAPKGAGGRPLLAEESLRVYTVSVRLDEQHYRKLIAYATASGRKNAAVLRALLDGEQLLTAEAHERLRALPDLINVTARFADLLESQQRGAEAQQVAAWQLRMEAILNGFERLVCQPKRR